MQQVLGSVAMMRMVQLSGTWQLTSDLWNLRCACACVRACVRAYRICAYVFSTLVFCCGWSTEVGGVAVVQFAVNPRMSCQSWNVATSKWLKRYRHTQIRAHARQ